MAQWSEEIQEKAEKVLAHTRYLAGCACQQGDFDQEPVPTNKEWEALLLSAEDVLSDMMNAHDY